MHSQNSLGINWGVCNSFNIGGGTPKLCFKITGGTHYEIECPVEETGWDREGYEVDPTTRKRPAPDDVGEANAQCVPAFGGPGRLAL